MELLAADGRTHLDAPCIVVPACDGAGSGLESDIVLPSRCKCERLAACSIEERAERIDGFFLPLTKDEVRHPAQQRLYVIRFLVFGEVTSQADDDRVTLAHGTRMLVFRVFNAVAGGWKFHFIDYSHSNSGSVHLFVSDESRSKDPCG